MLSRTVHVKLSDVGEHAELAGNRPVDAHVGDVNVGHEAVVKAAAALAGACSTSGGTCRPWASHHHQCPECLDGSKAAHDAAVICVMLIYSNLTAVKR